MPNRPEQERPHAFAVTVHGTVFAERAARVDGLAAGDPLLLIPDPPGTDDPAVWVHLPAGDPVGHLPPEINRWMVPWMLEGGRATAVALKVGGADVPSWKRLLIEIRLDGELPPAAGPA